MKDLFKYLIKEFHEEELPELIERDLNVNIVTKVKKAIIIMGPRRAGKSYYLFQLIKRLVQNKVDKKEIVYINFEDNRIPFLRREDLNSIPEAHQELYPDTNDTYYFLDELQNIDEWERFVRTLLDKGKKVILTGSNAKLLGREISTNLRGRSISYELFPFTIQEIARYKHVVLERNWEYGKTRYKVKRIIDDYLKHGGYPEITLTESEMERKKIIDEYFNTLLYNDIAERYKIRNTKLLKLLLKYLINNYGRYFTINAFKNYCASFGIKTSTSTIFDLVNSIDGVYFSFLIRKFDYSFKKQEVNPKKVYVIDNAYLNYLTTKEEQGRLLENTVAIKLISMDKHLFYDSSDRYECDFLVFDKRKPKEAIQVVWKLHQKNRDREIKGILYAMKRYNLKNGLIITYDQEDTIKIENKVITVKPLWKWIMS